MNKLYRYILVWIFALIPCFSNATFTQIDLQQYQWPINTSYWYDGADIACIQLKNCQGFSYNTFNGSYALNIQNWHWSWEWNAFWLWSCATSRLYFSTDNSNCTFQVAAYKYDQTPMTSLECQTEYNLIPVSEVTANYCKLNYDLIDPADCPINEWTGTIVRSNLTINNTPYAQNQNINVYIPDFLAWNVAFNDFNTTIEVEGYNADEDYINNVIDQEKLTPTNEDFTNMILALTWFIPYLFIALLFFWIVRIINRIWK